MSERRDMSVQILTENALLSDRMMKVEQQYRDTNDMLLSAVAAKQHLIDERNILEGRLNKVEVELAVLRAENEALKRTKKWIKQSSQ